MIDKIKFKCHWHDFDCDRGALCTSCPQMPKDEDKPNYHKPRKRAEIDGWGMPVCPSCSEPTYDEKRCFFCGQSIKLEKYLSKPLIVGWKNYKGVFVEGGIWIYDKGKFVTHAHSPKKFTPTDARKLLKSMPKFVKAIKEIKNDRC